MLSLAIFIPTRVPPSLPLSAPLASPLPRFLPSSLLMLSIYTLHTLIAFEKYNSRMSMVSNPQSWLSLGRA